MPALDAIIIFYYFCLARSSQLFASLRLLPVVVPDSSQSAAPPNLAMAEPGAVFKAIVQEIEKKPAAARRPGSANLTWPGGQGKTPETPGPKLKLTWAKESEEALGNDPPQASPATARLLSFSHKPLGSPLIQTPPPPKVAARRVPDQSDGARAKRPRTDKKSQAEAKVPDVACRHLFAQCADAVASATSGPSSFESGSKVDVARSQEPSCSFLRPGPFFTCLLHPPGPLPWE